VLYQSRHRSRRCFAPIARPRLRCTSPHKSGRPSMMPAAGGRTAHRRMPRMTLRDKSPGRPSNVASFWKTPRHCLLIHNLLKEFHAFRALTRGTHSLSACRSLVGWTRTLRPYRAERDRPPVRALRKLASDMPTCRTARHSRARKRQIRLLCQRFELSSRCPARHPSLLQLPHHRHHPIILFRTDVGMGCGGHDTVMCAQEGRSQS